MKPSQLYNSSQPWRATKVAEGKLTGPRIRRAALQARAQAAVEVVEEPQAADHIAQTMWSKGEALEATARPGWGWLPALSPVSALGVLVMACAYTAARAGKSWDEALFWIGLLTIFAPVAARLLVPRASRRERIGLIVILGLNLYLTNLLLSPVAVTGYDEFLHWRTAQDIIATHHLFQPNPVLPISPLYPGLEIVTTAISSMSGLSIFAAGAIVVAVARLVFMLALYLFYERLSGSAWIASVGVVIYVANPHFLFFDAAFAYESLALPFAMLTLYAVARRTRLASSLRLGLAVTIVLGTAAIVITHHVTSYTLAGFLILWSVVWYVLRRRRAPDQGDPRWPALLTLALSALWVWGVARLAVSYLAPVLTSALDGLVSILAAQSSSRTLFKDSTGYVTPLWQRLIALASVALIVLGLPFGLDQIRRRWRANAAVVSLGVATLAYPASQALRIVPSGDELADRATSFAFVALALVLAIAVVERWLARSQSWKRLTAMVVVFVVVFMGQLISGAGPPWSLLPGPYLVEADNRSITPEGINAALWAAKYLGPGQRIATDRDDEVMMATYGHQWIVSTTKDGTPLASVFFAPQMGEEQQAELASAQVHYLVVDRRLSTSLPQYGYYYSSEEYHAFAHQKPISAQALAKFGATPGVSTVFDSGNIVIYDVSGIAQQP